MQYHLRDDIRLIRSRVWRNSMQIKAYIYIYVPPPPAIFKSSTTPLQNLTVHRRFCPALCEGNPPVTGGLFSQRPVTRSFDISLICAWTNVRANNRDAGNLRRHRLHYEVTVRRYDGIFLFQMKHEHGNTVFLLTTDLMTQKARSPTSMLFT